MRRRRAARRRTQAMQVGRRVGAQPPPCSLCPVHSNIKLVQEIGSGHGSGGCPSRLASLSNLCPFGTEEAADHRGIPPSTPAGHNFG
ncbi:hypothetical protein AAC387_Pa03g0258 [Persea americana]